MQGRGHLLRGRKKSWENNDVEESKAIPPTQQSPTSTAGSGRFFPSETKSEANITVSRPHSSFVARSKSDTPSLKSHKQLQQGRPRPISDQFPQTNAASRPTRVDGFGEHHNRSDAQRQMMPQVQARSSYVGNAYEEDVVFLRDNVSPSRSMNRESQESRGNPRIIPDVPYQDSQRERTKGDDQMNSSRTLKPAMLSTERYERGKEKWYRPPSGLMNEGERPRDGWYRPPPRPAYEDEAPREEWYGPNPGLTNEIWRNWDFGDAQKAQASSSQQRPASQIVSPRSSKYSEEPQRSMDEGQRIPRPSAQQVYQDSEPTDRLYQSQYTRGVSSSAYQPMPSQRRSTDSNESEASGLSEVDGQHYRRDAEDEEYYGLRQMRRSKTDHFGYDSRPNEVKGQQPVLRRHTGFGNQELGGREERGPRREYVTDEGRPSSDSESDFQWKVRVRWDDPDSLYASFDYHDCIMKFDSGCENSNWVSEDVARRVKAHIKPLESAERYIAFNGASMNPIGQTSLAFARVDGGGPLPRAVFLVAQGDNVPFDVILGARDSVRFGFMQRPRDPSDASMVWGLAAAPMTPEQKKKQEERDMAQTQTRKEQKDKQKWLLRKKVGEQKQDPSSSKHDRHGESSKRNATTR